MIYQMVLLDLGHTRHIQFEDGRLLGVKCVANAKEPTLPVDASHCSDWGNEHASCQELAGHQRDLGILRTVMCVCQGLARCQEDTGISNDNPSAYLLTCVSMTLHCCYGDLAE
jgi:hypothetical protein